MKILIAGGHLTPALALIDFIQKNHPENKVVFVGRRYSQLKNKQTALESQEIKRRNITFVDLVTPKYNLNQPLKIIPTLLLYPFSVFKSLIILLKHKPNVFVSFGGYLAVPLALAAWLLRIPIITHEQTVVAGNANKLIGKFAKKVALSFTTSKDFFPAHKTVVTGNPIRPEILKKQTSKPNWLKSDLDKPLLFITGGNQGSFTLNNNVAQLLPKLTKKYLIIHACGKPTNQANYKQELQSIANKLPSNQRKNYYVKEWVSADELAWILQSARCVVARSGANTVYELILNRVPSVLVPLNISKNDEQTKNAKLMADKGLAELLPQKDLNPSSLLKKIDYVAKFHRSMKKKGDSLILPTDGAAKLYEELISIVQK